MAKLRTLLVSTVASSLLIYPVAVVAAMTPQPALRNSDGSSQIADPDQAIERMAAKQSHPDARRVRTYSDSSSEARDMVQTDRVGTSGVPR